MQHLVERGARAEQRPLLRRNAETEQQRRRTREQTRQARMKQPVQAIQRLQAREVIRLAGQQRREIDPGELRQQMRKTDEAAEHTVAVKSVGEIGMPRTADHVALVPIGARIGVQHQPQPLAIELRVGGRSGLAEELPELGVTGKCAKPGKLELEQRKMRLVEVDGIDLGRLRGEIGQRVAAAGGDRDDGRAERQLQRGKIGFRILPDLGVDQAAEPECEQPVPDGRLGFIPAVANRVRDQLRVHPSLESTISSRYRRLTAVLRQRKAL